MTSSKTYFSGSWDYFPMKCAQMTLFPNYFPMSFPNEVVHIVSYHTGVPKEVNVSEYSSTLTKRRRLSWLQKFTSQ